MQTTVVANNAEVTIRLNGRFDFHANKEFKAAYSPAFENNAIREITVNLAGVSYLDSSAFGMLLLLRDRCEKTGRKVSLSGTRGEVASLLACANFDKLFVFKD